MTPGPVVRLSVRLTPRGGRDSVDGVGEAGELRCRVAAAAVDGAANRSLIRLLAGELGLAPSALTIEAGQTARTKRLSIVGLDATALEVRWPGVRVAGPPARR